MTLVLRRLKVYLKLAAMVAVVIALLVVVLKNQEHKARIWFFWIDDEVHVLWLILITALSAVVAWWGFLKIFGVLRELRDVRRQVESKQQLEQQRRLAQELAERERRIDEKVKRSISEPGD